MQPTAYHFAKVFAALVIVVAMLGDSAAAWAILSHQVAPGILVHGIAALLWLVTQGWFFGTHSNRESLSQLLASEAGSGSCIVLCLFPVLGMFTESIAIAINDLFGPPVRHKITTMREDDPMMDILEIVNRDLVQPFDPRDAITVEPLAVRFKTATALEKRAAIDLICQCHQPRGLELVRQLLSDSDPDIRALAALAVDRLGQDRAEETLDS